MRDVVVVGAGVAGLAAASDLAAKGLDVVVVEARDRIGGRTHTETLGGAPVDLGAAWIHDPVHNPLTGLVDTLGLRTRSDGMFGRGMRAFSDGGWLSAEQTSTLVAALYNFDARAARAAPAVASDRFSDGISWYLETQMAPDTRTTAVEAFLSRVVGAGVIGNDAGEISLQGLDAYEGEESGHNSVLVGGYRTLVERLAIGLDVELATPISEIQHSDSEVIVVGGDRSVETRWVVVTIPLAVLKSGAVRFLPEMPARHVRALSRLKTKSLEKVILTFDDRFWGEDLFQIAVLDDQHGFIWIHDLSAHSGVPTLAAFYNPAIASKPTTRDEAVSAFFSLLVEMFGQVPEVRHVTTTCWAVDPYSLGSYSFIPVGGSTDDMAALAAPVGHRVLLAGEHTFPEYYGTVQAAWLSGRRAASAIINNPASRG